MPPAQQYFHPHQSAGTYFRDRLEAFDAANAVILGVSKDNPSCHDKFKTKYDLNFTLVSDEDGKLCAAYDVWKEKSMYGKKYMGIDRSTFLIDKDGVIRKEWRKVSVTDHADEVLKEVRKLGSREE